MSNTYTAVLLTELDGMQELADLLESIPTIVDFELHPGRLVGEGDQFGEPADQIPGQTELADPDYMPPRTYRITDTGALEPEGDA